MRVLVERGTPPRLVDEAGDDVPHTANFFRALQARGSPNTAASYAYDLKRFLAFLRQAGVELEQLRPRHAIEFLVHLRSQPARHRPPSPDGGPVTLAASSINRIIAAASSFYDHLILTEAVPGSLNPLEASEVVASGARRRQRLFRRYARLPRVERLARPLSEDQITRLLKATRSRRDIAVLLLMLHGGLRVGEVLNLQLEDVQYGRRRVVIRYVNDHPKGARCKTRAERVVDLYEPETLAAVSAYVTHERPRGKPTDYLFLAGGWGATAGEPIGYAALAKWFQRRKQAAGLTEAWITLHSLRHTHATRMWEGGMNEFSLQKRLGHASFEATKIYTRVSDEALLAEYQKVMIVRTRL